MQESALLLGFSEPFLPSNGRFRVWEPHTPCRTPTSYGEPFAQDPVPDWITEEIRTRHWAMPGPHLPDVVGIRRPTPELG